MSSCPCWGGVVRLIDWIYPVGAVLASTNPDYNPNNIFKTHTWERFAKGQTLVGVNESDTAFNTVGKTGGEKTHKLTEAEMPSHQHNVYYYKGAVSDYLGGSPNDYGLSYQTTARTGSYSDVLANVGGGAAHNNMQPYTTVFYWKRTA